MTSITEVDPEDSGVSSSGATPEGQPGSANNMSSTAKTDNIDKDTSDAINSMLASVISKAEEDAEKESKNSTANSDTKSSSAGLSLSLKASTKQTSDDIDIDDDDEDLEETLLERIVGLTEMFPESLRSSTYNLVSGSCSLIKSGYSLTRQVVWVAVSSSVILFAPVMFELERLNVEEMMKQDRNRLVLGPGSAMSGSPGGGLVPPPPTR